LKKGKIKGKNEKEEAEKRKQEKNGEETSIAPTVFRYLGAYGKTD